MFWSVWIGLDWSIVCRRFSSARDHPLLSRTNSLTKIQFNYRYKRVRCFWLPFAKTLCIFWCSIIWMTWKLNKYQRFCNCSVFILYTTNRNQLNANENSNLAWSSREMRVCGLIRACVCMDAIGTYSKFDNTISSFFFYPECQLLNLIIKYYLACSF